MKKWYFISPLVLQKLIWIPTRIILRFFGHVEINGLENLKIIKGNAIFALNHSSELDPILPPAALPFLSHFSPMFYTSREREFYVNAGWRKHLYGGVFFKAWGSYPVHVGLHDYEKSLEFHIKIVREGGSLCVFPEGRITSDGSIQPAKGGVAYLSYATGVPIIPVRIDGAFHISLADFFLRRRRLSISFGKPLLASFFVREGASPDDFKHCADIVMSKIRNMRPKSAHVPGKRRLLSPVGV